MAERLNDNQLETLAAHGAVRDCSTTGRAGDSLSTVWAKVELVRKAAAEIRELRVALGAIRRHAERMTGYTAMPSLRLAARTILKCAKSVLAEGGSDEP